MVCSAFGVILWACAGGLRNKIYIENRWLYCLDKSVMTSVHVNAPGCTGLLCKAIEETYPQRTLPPQSNRSRPPLQTQGSRQNGFAGGL